MKYAKKQEENNGSSKKWKKFKQEEMKEGAHQLELKEGYEADEAYDESEN